jgi:hypothetical protein
MWSWHDIAVDDEVEDFIIALVRVSVQWLHG